MTITRSDALDVMAIVTACHRRTAPRMDDRDVARATADVWAELFNTHRLELSDLLAAVKMRAQFEKDAPEPAEIITFARKIRKDRDADAGPSPAYEALCESKAEDAAELAERRRLRELSPAVERPRLRELVAALADQKRVAP
jgi:hypothetical protein